MAILAVFSAFASILLVNRKRQPITPVQAVWAVVINGLLVYALLG